MFYRLNVVPIRIPPLRERPEDILELAEIFFKRYTKIHQKELKGIAKEAEKLLLRHPFPGNVRELENLIEYGVIFEKEYFLTEQTLLKKIGGKKGLDTSIVKGGLKEMVAQYEKNVIEDLINHYGKDTESKRKIAKKLEISPATLYRKLNEVSFHNQSTQ